MLYNFIALPSGVYIWDYGYVDGWFVEERAETIERSEIVEVRTYSLCRLVCIHNIFPGGPINWIGAFHLERRESKPKAWVRMNKDIEIKAHDSHPGTNEA
jgi:hypothetical protein